MWARTIAIILPWAIILLAGCEQAAPEPEKPEEPPPPTAEEIYRDLRQPIAPLWQQDITVAEATSIPNAFQTAYARHRSALNIDEARRRITNEVEQRVRETRRNKQARVLKGAVGVYKILEPGSTRFESHERWADLMIAQPNVAIRGFFSQGDTAYVMLTVIDPQTGAQYPMQVREGDRFYRETLRLKEIIGNNAGIEVIYQPTQEIRETFTVMAG